VLAHLDGWSVSVADAPTEDWSKGAAVASLLGNGAPDDVLVIHDADVIVDTYDLMDCAVRVRRHGGWAMPHRRVARLDEDSTESFLRNGQLPDEPRLARPVYDGMVGGGVVILSRSTYDDCPLDWRFQGWGSEDQAWGWALGALHGEPYQRDATLWHLYHPHAEPNARRSPRWESEQLWRAYRAYRRQPERLRALVHSAQVAGDGG
jgi:hypothetical protein